MRELGNPGAQGERGSRVSSGPRGAKGERKAAGVQEWGGMGIRKEPATVTRRLSESLDFALMPLGFKNQRLLAREWPLYRRRRFDTFHRPDSCAAGLAGWQTLFTWSPGLCTDQCWKGRPSSRREPSRLLKGRALTSCLSPISAQAEDGGPGSGVGK